MPYSKRLYVLTVEAHNSGEAKIERRSDRSVQTINRYLTSPPFSKLDDSYYGTTTQATESCHIGIHYRRSGAFKAGEAS